MPNWIMMAASDVLANLLPVETTALAKYKPTYATDCANFLTRMANEARGYVGANDKNQMATAPAVPPELVTAVTDRTIFALLKTLPVATLLTPDRRDANKAALATFNDVKRGLLAITQPDSAELAPTQPVTGGFMRTVNPGRKLRGREFDGL
jgi:hypothetical protein